MKPRFLAYRLLRAARTFPALVITGPRQSGKTTLLKNLFSKSHRFISLEDPDSRIQAKNDPRGFLDHYGPPIILDEIQYVPELLSYIKTRIDENRKPGQWLLTGSQNFVLMQGVSQSLAGRVAVFSLLPFSYSERIGKGDTMLDPAAWIRSMEKTKTPPSDKTSLAELILRGNYPEIASKKSVDRQTWCRSYITTYLERDIRSLVHVGDLGQFELFLQMCAARTGQLFQLSEIAGEIGISHTTAKKWLSVLETGYQVFRLLPYYKNMGKRLRKTPKLYFHDTGIASYLLGLHNKETLLKSPHFGNLFETFIVTDVMKRFLHAGEMPRMYYLRTRDGLEIDLIVDVNFKLNCFEIKSTATVFPKHGASLQKFLGGVNQTDIGKVGIISQSNASFVTKKVDNFFWKTLLAS